jgi:hypothetical protein
LKWKSDRQNLSGWISWWPGSAIPATASLTKMRLAVLFPIFVALICARAQESPSPSPVPSPARTVSLRFALPPMEGTISLGIYDRAGKLVRVLHREDAVSKFTAGHDALETIWDGNDEHGDPLPNGKYSARGFVVGDLKVEGVDYFFNDWVTDEKSPHIRSLGQLWLEKGALRVDAELTGGRKAEFVCDQTTGDIQSEVTPTVGIHCRQQPTQSDVVLAIDCAAGKNDTTWFVDSLGGSGPREVKQVSQDHELLRRLQYGADDPQPERIEVSPTEEKIFLIEQNENLQRLRALTLVGITKGATGEAVSDWKTHFEKKILGHRNFALEKGRLVPNATGPVLERVKFSQTLRPDPLQHDKPGKVDLAIGIDTDGSYLKTFDGLPLRTISDTPNLTRTLMAQPNESTIDVYQDDGAVVEQFRISSLAQMIAFDCGDFELK